MKTAIQYLKEQISYDDDYGQIKNAFTEGKDLSEFYERAELIFRQQIEKAWIDGKEHEGYGDSVFSDAELYFEKTFKQ
jgi:hypothetical protein